MIRLLFIHVLSMLLCLAGTDPLSSVANDSQSPMELIGQLQDGSPEIRLTAIRLLRKQGPQAKSATSALATLLEDADPRIRIEAARALGAIGPGAAVAIPSLVKRFDDHNAVMHRGPVWYAAAQAVGKIGGAALPHLMPLLEKQDWNRFLPVAEALHGIGNEAKAAVPFLLRSLENQGDASIRKGSIYALGGIGAVTVEVVPALIPMLQHSDFHTRYFACRALGEIGPDAKQAAGPLIGLTKTGVASVRRHAARALGNFGPSGGNEAVDSLIKLLADRAYPVRVEAVSALGKMGSKAKVALPQIQHALHHKPLGIRVEAARAIWTLTGQASEVVPVLVAELENIDNAIQAARLLGEIGADAGPATDALIKVTTSEDPALQAAAAAALKKIQAD